MFAEPYMAFLHLNKQMLALNEGAAEEDRYLWIQFLVGKYQIFKVILIKIKYRPKNFRK